MPPFNEKNDSEIQTIIKRALEEDLGERGDVTSAFLLSSAVAGKAYFLAKQSGVIAGLPVAERVFAEVDSKLDFSRLVVEGSWVEPGTRVAEVSGSLTSLLTAERTALNFLQRLSGIATFTSRFVAEVKGTKVRILDTRKTTPGHRLLEKYAVRMGGGQNHRFGLFDMVMIKENHIAAAGNISTAVKNIKSALESHRLHLKIEVEATNLEQVQEAARLEVDRIMLDNMSIPTIRKAVQVIDGRIELEVSGGVTIGRVAEIAQTGVDFISVGALTHSAPALDLSMLIE